MNEVAKIQAIIKEKIPEGLVTPEHTEFAHFYKYDPTGEVFPSVTGITGIMSSGHLKQWSANEAVRYLEKHWDSITPENRPEYLKAAQMAHLDTLKNAGDIGTMAHKAIENYLEEWIETGKQPEDIKRFITEPDSRLFAAARSAELFFNDFHVIPIVSEIKLVHSKYKYGGTMDALMMVGSVINEGNAGRAGFPKCEHLWGESKGGKGKGSNHVECYHCGRKLKMTLTLIDFKSSNNIDHDDYAEQVSAYYYAFLRLTGIKPKQMFIVRVDKEKAKYEVVRVTDKMAAFKAFLHTKQKYDWMKSDDPKLLPVVVKEVIQII